MSTIRYHHQIIHTGKAFASTDSRSSGGVNWIPVEPPMRSLMFVSTESGLLEKCNEKRDANCTASSCITVENGWLRWSSPRKLDVGRFSLSHYSGHTWHAGSTQKTKAPRARILTCEAQSECREWVTPPPRWLVSPWGMISGLWSAPCKVQTKLRKNYLFRGTECHLEDTKSSKSSSRHLEHSPQQRLWCPVHHPSLLLSSWYAETMALLRSGSALLSQRWVFFSGIPVLSLLTTGISYLLQAYPV